MLITYPNFWKQFYRKFPQYREASITACEFEPGERVEVDYAGDPIEWSTKLTGSSRVLALASYSLPGRPRT